MKDEIKEILESLDKISKAEYYPEDLLTYKECHLLLDYITNLQEENERLLYIARKMHTWIFLNSGDEQKVYDELGLTDEENIALGYSGQFRIKGEDKDEKTME